MRRNRRQRGSGEPAELDVTPFMNLMIVLVPVLLLSLVFTHTAVIELDFPAGGAAGEIDPDAVHLEVHITADALIVADGRAVIRAIPALASGAPDYEQLAAVLREVKRRVPDKRDATLLLAADVDYQTLVFVMDRVRGYATVQDGQRITAELFPVLSLGDTPPADSQGTAQASRASAGQTS